MDAISYFFAGGGDWEEELVAHLCDEDVIFLQYVSLVFIVLLSLMYVLLIYDSMWYVVLFSGGSLL